MIFERDIRMKRIASIVILLILSTQLSAFASAGELGISLTEKQKLVEDEGYSVKWIDPGVDFTSTRYQGQGDGSEGLYCLEARKKDGSSKWGFINGKGDIVIPCIYSSVQRFSDGLARVALNGKVTFIDTTGKEVVFDTNKYDSVDSFEHGFARTYLNEKKGIIDKFGNEVLPCEYDWVGWSQNGLIWAGNGELIFTVDGEVEQDNRKYALFDSTGKRLTEFEYGYIGFANWRDKWWDYLETDETEPLLAKKDDKYGFIDQTGKMVIPFEYETAFGGTEGIFAVCKDGKWGHIDSEGKIVTPFKYNDAEAFRDGLANVNKDGKWGYVDMQGNLVIPCEYDSEGYFMDGVATVTKTIDGSIQGYVIDKTGKAITGPKDYAIYTVVDPYLAEPFESTNRSCAILDKEGNRLTRFYPMSIGSFIEGIAQCFFIVDYELQCGLINQYGAEIVPPIFNNIEIVNSSTCIVQASEGYSDLNSRVGILTLPSDAATRKPPLSERPITVYLDGLDLYFDTEPTITSGRTMVPMRKIFETIGADVSWDGKEKKVTAVKGEISISLTIGNDKAVINGKTVELDAPAMIEDGRTLVPIRFVAESLNCDVSWESENRRVIITTGNSL